MPKIALMICAGIGTLSNLFPIAVYTFGCWNSNWTCSGDFMGGPMMLYGIVFFIPNIFVSFAMTVATLIMLAGTKGRIGFSRGFFLSMHGLSWCAVLAFMVRY